MREIKFRAWDIKHKAMDVVCSLQYELSTGNIWVVTTESEGPSGSRYKLLQYTGLRDKNGKEIYEGDIVKIPYVRTFPEMKDEIFIKEIVGNGIITYVYSGFSITGLDCSVVEPIIPSHVVVIGNVYENPELLGKEASIGD